MTDRPFLWRNDDGPVVDRRAAAAWLADRDPALGRIIERVGPITMERPAAATPFRYLLRAIVSQQLSVQAAATIATRLAGLYHPGHPTPARVLATPVARLRSAGLSAAKAAAVLDLARHAERRRLPGEPALRRMDPAEAIRTLTVVRGVGPWTAEMLLIFYLGHPDILPLLDLGIRKGFARVQGRRSLPAARTLARHGERWRPYRSIASWYLWRALELPSD